MCSSPSASRSRSKRSSSKAEPGAPPAGSACRRLARAPQTLASQGSPNSRPLWKSRGSRHARSARACRAGRPSDATSFLQTSRQRGTPRCKEGRQDVMSRQRHTPLPRCGFGRAPVRDKVAKSRLAKIVGTASRLSLEESGVLQTRTPSLVLGEEPRASPSNGELFSSAPRAGSAGLDGCFTSASSKELDRCVGMRRSFRPAAADSAQEAWVEISAQCVKSRPESIR